MVKIAINGFGRIGRMVVRAALVHSNIEVVACNDLTDKHTLANLFKYDSVHGTFPGTVEVTDNGILINGSEIKLFAERDPTKLPWGELEIDVVVESTGIFRTKEKLNYHLQAGAKRVVLSAPAKGGDVKTIVFGVNEHTFNPETDFIVSNASCTTNCLAPLVKILDDNFGVRKGYMTTVHAYTGGQNLVDGPNKDLRRARAAAVNITPTSTGAAKAVAEVIPHLAGKLDGMALRVPVSDGSITDFTCELNRETSVEEVNALMKNVSNTHMLGVLEFVDAPLVSSDIVGNSHSSIFDSQLTKVSGNLVKVVSWYDNEWGYSNRVVDLLLLISNNS